MSTITYNKRDIQRILKKNGWTPQSQRGSHVKYVNERNEHMSVNVENCNKMVFQRLIKQYDLKV